MQDEVTVGEIMRRLEAVRQDCREDTQELRSLLDFKVSMERYQLEQLAREEAYRLLVSRVLAVETAREREAQQRRDEAQRLADRRAADRRLILTAMIAPILMLFLQLYLSARGAGQ